MYISRGAVYCINVIYHNHVYYTCNILFHTEPYQSAEYKDAKSVHHNDICDTGRRMQSQTITDGSSYSDNTNSSR